MTGLWWVSRWRVTPVCIARRCWWGWGRAADFAKAIVHYSEAIKRNPAEAAVYYCNRAAARTKLMDFNSALEDCNAALKQNPTYVKAFSRTGALEFLRKEYHKRDRPVV